MAPSALQESGESGILVIVRQRRRKAYSSGLLPTDVAHPARLETMCKLLMAKVGLRQPSTDLGQSDTDTDTHRIRSELKQARRQAAPFSQEYALWKPWRYARPCGMSFLQDRLSLLRCASCSSKRTLCE